MTFFLPAPFNVFFSFQLGLFFVSEQAARFYVGNVAIDAGEKILPHVSEWGSGRGPARAVGGSYDKVFLVFHYYNIPQERHFVKGKLTPRLSTSKLASGVLRVFYQLTSIKYKNF